MYWNLEASVSDEKEKEKYQTLASQAYQKIEELTQYYNTTLSHGKWQNMMAMHPRNLPVFDSLKKNPFFRIEKKGTGNSIVIQANQFVSQNGFKSYNWKSINGLGYSNNAITLFPFRQNYFKTPKPSVLYEFEIEKTGDYTIEVHLLPTHSNNFDHEIGVGIDGNSSSFFKINTKDRDKAWKENVLRNSAVVKVPVSNLQKGKHTFKIEVNQTGIVLDYLTVEVRQ